MHILLLAVDKRPGEGLDRYVGAQTAIGCSQEAQDCSPSNALDSCMTYSGSETR